MDQFFAPSLLVLTKTFSVGAVAMISVKRKLLQAITTLFCSQLLENSIFGHFHHFMGNFLIPPPLLSIKPLSLGAVAKISTERESYSRLLPLYFPAIWLKIEFGHFWPFAPAYGWPLDPTFTFFDKNVITGCCCNEIYHKKGTPGYYHPIFLPFPLSMQPLCFLAILSKFAYF